jgi:ribosomal protein L29
MGKEYLKQNIANKRVELVKLRSKMQKIKETKSKTMKDLAQKIKSTKIASNKESYRKQKISEACHFDREIASIKRNIEQVKTTIESYKKDLKR